MAVKKDQKNKEWLSWIREHGIAFFVFMLISVAFIAFVGFRTNSRLNDIEEQLKYDPPRSYQAPDLAAYAASRQLWREASSIDHNDETAILVTDASPLYVQPDHLPFQPRPRTRSRRDGHRI